MSQTYHSLSSKEEGEKGTVGAGIGSVCFCRHVATSNQRPSLYDRRRKVPSRAGWSIHSFQSVTAGKSPVVEDEGIRTWVFADKVTIVIWAADIFVSKLRLNRSFRLAYRENLAVRSFLSLSPLISTFILMAGPFQVYQLTLSTLLILSLWISGARSCEGECISSITNVFNGNYTIPVQLTILSLVRSPTIDP